MRWKVKSLSRVWLFVIPWTVAYHAPPSMGFFQARVLEWVAISFSRRSSQPRDWTWVSCIVVRCFTIWATREVTQGEFHGTLSSEDTQKQNYTTIQKAWKNLLCFIARFKCYDVHWDVKGTEKSYSKGTCWNSVRNILPNWFKHQTFILIILTNIPGNTFW